ncbi:hypothetical protein [Amycolatopsis sp. H20-H5]|uniref:hypothetical protein n=1 Tax=Amycolatopsis sp. H20-H5 TaxID=3046309 RepID=UPI002DBA6530|nr:hypothetical protein [Amycolatopsis sp. H20-H5]MEC3976253.1 hypothetical protein [Amycolatopsis sp. H20-H5]
MLCVAHEVDYCRECWLRPPPVTGTQVPPAETARVAELIDTLGGIGLMLGEAIGQAVSQLLTGSGLAGERFEPFALALAEVFPRAAAQLGDSAAYHHLKDVITRYGERYGDSPRRVLDTLDPANPYVDPRDRLATVRALGAADLDAVLAGQVHLTEDGEEVNHDA